MPDSLGSAARPEGETPPVLVTYEEATALVTFNQPRSRNAMTEAMRTEFASVLDSVRMRKDVRCLILTGAGPSFSAGGDLAFMRALPTLRPLGAMEQLEAVYPTYLDLLRFPIPTVAAINGPAIGGGMGIALLCDIRLAAESATMGAPFGAIGLPPGMGLTRLLPLIVGRARALELFLTSEVVDATRAFQMGLVGAVVPDDDLLSSAMTMAARIGAQAPGVLRFVREELLRQVGGEIEDALRSELRAQALAVQTSDYVEGLEAIEARRNPHFTGG